MAWPRTLPATRNPGADRRPAGQAPELPLAEAKLAVPGLRRHVDRPRVRLALDDGADAALTLVAAPPGYGKTTEARAWCATLDAALAWVTLDAGDDDPIRLWTYVAAAVDRVREGLGRAALQQLRLSGGVNEHVLDALLNGLAAFAEPLVLVLDDLQAVAEPECLATIDYVLERLPANARLVALTRADPALRLPQLRAGGKLKEVRADELAFTVDEARALLVEHLRVDLGEEEIALLNERAVGWPAALVLAGLWLQRVDDPKQAVREFGGTQRFVADYLSGEVFASLDDDRRSFLQECAVLGRFTAELCEEVLDRPDAASALGELERSNLFVQRRDRGGWFGVHSLFAEFAVASLAAVDPGAAERIHRRAAARLRARGLAIEAIEHAAAAGDHETVAQILDEHHLLLIRTGATRTLLRWTGTLPDDRLARHPDLAAAAATAAMLVGHSTIERRRLLQLAERARAAHPDRPSLYSEVAIRLVRAITADGGVGQAVRDGRDAVELAEEGGVDELSTAALCGYARALYYAGDLDGARDAALRALEHPDAARRPPSHAIARSTLALVAAERGLLASARAHAETAKTVVGGIGTSRSWLGAIAAAALGAVLASEDKLAQAERELTYAEHFLGDEIPTVDHAWVLVLLARVRARRGRLDEAEATLREARLALAELADAGRLPAQADEVGVELERARARADRGELLEAPSEAELAVLRLLATDLSIRQIGEQLFLSPNTIRTHIRALYRKLGANARPDAVARATALALLVQERSPG